MKTVSVGLLTLLAVLFVASTASAAWVSLGGDRGASVTVLDSTPRRIALEFRVDGFEQNDIVIDGRGCSLISLPGEAERLEAGLPELPVVARSVLIPDDRRMELRVTNVEYTDVHGITPVPSKGDLSRTVDPAQVPFVFDAFYSGDSWYPAQEVTQREPYILRDFRGTAVVATPIRYQPSTSTLRVVTRMVVELVDSGPGGANVLVRNRTLSSISTSFDEIYREHFLNYEMQHDKYTAVPESGKMLVICYDAFASAMQPFVDWKNQMGLPTTMVLASTVGTTAAQFSTYIANAYNQAGSPALAFVLLVGDSGQIPSPYMNGGSADPTYGKITGNDWYPEVFIGRFSAENVAQVQTQVQRSVNYEKNPLLAGSDWYAKGTGIASNQGPGDDGEMDFQHVGNIRTKLLNYGYTWVDEIYDPYATSAMVATALNQGRAIINYCGHGSQNAWSSSGFSSTHVAALTNDNMLPFIFSVACVNGQFSGGSCFAEAWLRATHNGNPSGAVATYMSSINQGWNPPMCAEDEADDILVQDRGRTYGSLCFNGSCQMIDEYGNSGANEFNAWHIFGDPSLRIRSKAPVAVVATHETVIAPDATSFPVASNCPDALCALYYNGALLGSAVADHGGNANISVTGALPDGQEITLTVTGYNRIPYIVPITVQPLIMPVLVLDPTSFEVTVQPNEIVSDTLRLSNQGHVASILSFQLTFSSFWRNIVTMAQTSGDVAYGETVAIPISFGLAGLAPGTYTGFIRVAYNPNQHVDVPVVLHVDDVAAGVGDGRAVPAVLTLETARPNPFVGSAIVSYGLPAVHAARLAIYDASGRAVRTLADGTALAGYHHVVWNGRDDAGRAMPAGVYFARLDAAGQSLSQRLLRVR